MEFQKLFQKFLDGDRLTNPECLDLFKGLKAIEETLIGKGDFFYASRMLASSNLDRIRGICEARKLRVDGDD